MCQYNTALEYGNLTTWCAAFSNLPRDLLALEYVEDLLYCYKDCYEYDINWNQACNPVVDVAKYFNSMVLGETRKPDGVFYFVHSDATSKLFARWGFYKD